MLIGTEHKKYNIYRIGDAATAWHLPQSKAIETAEALAKEDQDGWTYVVCATARQGEYTIRVIDCDGEILGYL